MALVGLCALVALRRPTFGMLVFVFLGIFVPHSMTWAIARNSPLSQLVAIATIAGYLFWNEPKKFPRQRESILLLLLWSMFGISTLFAIYPDRAFSDLKDVSKILLVIFLITSLINSEQRLRWFSAARYLLATAAALTSRAGRPFRACKPSVGSGFRGARV